MGEKNTADFQNKMDITYEQYFRAIFGTMVDFYNLLEEGVGEDKALENIFELSVKKNKDNLSKFLESEDIYNFQDFIKVYKKQLETDFFINCQSYTVEEESEERFKIKINECIMAKTFNELDAGDVGYNLCCKPDFEVVSLFHPNIRLNRTKTLMQEDEYCDFEYYWEE